MKTLITFVCLMLCSLTDFAQQTTLWEVFGSTTCDAETFETGYVTQNFIKVRQVGNRFYWGESNYFDVYNKDVNHDGFSSYTSWDFIDKFKQRGQMIYQNNRNADWGTRNMFYIFYEGRPTGMLYLSRDPQQK